MEKVKLKRSTKLIFMSAHDAIVDLPPFKIEFWPLQAIFDDFVLIFCSKLTSKVSIEAH
jgi:5-methylcytosine-specific restriction endonuclease McrBC regulatory subunit McrC